MQRKVMQPRNQSKIGMMVKNLEDELDFKRKKIEDLKADKYYSFNEDADPREDDHAANKRSDFSSTDCNDHSICEVNTGGFTEQRTQNEELDEENRMTKTVEGEQPDFASMRDDEENVSDDSFDDESSIFKTPVKMVSIEKETELSPNGVLDDSGIFSP